jgi:hypothetical protein
VGVIPIQVDGQDTGIEGPVVMVTTGMS